MMKIKDNFLLGILLSVLIFFVLYGAIILFTDYAFFSTSRDGLWVYVISMIPNLLLSRFMLVNWDLESTGKGMMFSTLISIVVVMFIVLR